MCENCREREQSMGLQESENCDKDQSTESCGPQPMFLPLAPPGSLSWTRFWPRPCQGSDKRARAANKKPHRNVEKAAQSGEKPRENLGESVSPAAAANGCEMEMNDVRGIWKQLPHGVSQAQGCKSTALSAALTLAKMRGPKAGAKSGEKPLEKPGKTRPTTHSPSLWLTAVAHSFICPVRHSFISLIMFLINDK